MKLLNVASLFGAGLLTAVSLLMPNAALAQSVTMNEAMLARCDAEGLSGETCACWFYEIAVAEGLEEFTEEDIDELAPYYQEELDACIEANE